MEPFASEDKPTSGNHYDVKHVFKSMAEVLRAQEDIENWPELSTLELRYKLEDEWRELGIWRQRYFVCAQEALVSEQINWYLKSVDFASDGKAAKWTHIGVYFVRKEPLLILAGV
jgi:hypothetical protein